jgi:hypothetical protein
MRTAARAALLLAAAYVGTLAITAAVATAIVAVMSPSGCSEMSRAFLVVWIAIAGVVCVSVAVVGVAAWRLRLALIGRIAVVVTYALLVLATYVMIALASMLAFNC